MSSRALLAWVSDKVARAPASQDCYGPRGPWRCLDMQDETVWLQDLRGRLAVEAPFATESHGSSLGLTDEDCKRLNAAVHPLLHRTQWPHHRNLRPCAIARAAMRARMRRGSRKET